MQRKALLEEMNAVRRETEVVCTGPDVLRTAIKVVRTRGEPYLVRTYGYGI